MSTPQIVATSNWRMSDTIPRSVEGAGVGVGTDQTQAGHLLLEGANCTTSWVMETVRRNRPGVMREEAGAA